MAVKGLTALTLADWGKRVDPNGKVDKIIELLGQTNPILQDMPFVEGNLPTGHRTTIRSGLPSATWRLLNYGVQLKWSTKTGHRVRVFSSIDFPIRLVVTHHYIRAVLVRCNIQRYSPLLRELHR